MASGKKEGGAGRREKSAMFDSSHLFIATESLTALSVNSIDLTHPAELIKHAGWTLYRKEKQQEECFRQ